MKRVYKITAWTIGGIVLIIAALVAIPFIKDILNPDFEKTTIYSKEDCGTALREFDHCNVKAGSLGLRLVLYPDTSMK